MIKRRELTSNWPDLSLNSESIKKIKDAFPTRWLMIEAMNHFFIAFESLVEKKKKKKDAG